MKRHVDYIAALDDFFLVPTKDYSGEKLLECYSISTDQISDIFLEYTMETVDKIPHGIVKRFMRNGTIAHQTIFVNGKDSNVNPDTLVKKDWAYFKLSGRLPEKFNEHPKT